MKRTTYKLTKEEFDALYADDTTRFEYRRILSKAQARMIYVKRFIETVYFNDDMDFDLVYDNSISSQYGIVSRETNDDKGHYDPERYKNIIVLVLQVEYDSIEESFPECEFDLINIKPYNIEIDSKILYTDFEQQIIDYIENNGDPETLRKAKFEKLHKEYITEINAFKNSLTKEQLRLVDRVISFESWQELKPYEDFYK